MNCVARGALLISLLPRWPQVVTARELAAEMRRRGVRIHVRSVQRDLESLPASLVRRRTERKPYGWARLTQRQCVDREEKRRT
jgi:hypothetical protein